MRLFSLALVLLTLPGCMTASRGVVIVPVTETAERLSRADADAIWARDASQVGAREPIQNGERGPLAGAKLLGRVLESLGGREAWREVAAYSTRGSSAVPTAYGEISVASASTVAGADRVRVEQSTPVGNILVRVDGERASLNVDGVDRPPPPGFVASVRSQLLFTVPYVLMHARDLRVSRGADVDGLASLRYTAPGVGAIYEARIGADGRPVEIHSLQPGPAGLARLVYTVSDYREVGALVVPHRYVHTADGVAAGSTSLAVFRVNPDVSAEAFGG